MICVRRSQCLCFLTLKEANPVSWLAVFLVALCLGRSRPEMMSSLWAVCRNKVSASASHPAGNLIHSSVCLIKDQWRAAGCAAALCEGVARLSWCEILRATLFTASDWLRVFPESKNVCFKFRSMSFLSILTSKQMFCPRTTLINVVRNT